MHLLVNTNPLTEAVEVTYILVNTDSLTAAVEVVGGYTFYRPLTHPPPQDFIYIHSAFCLKQWEVVPRVILHSKIITMQCILSRDLLGNVLQIVEKLEILVEFVEYRYLDSTNTQIDSCF